MKFILSATPEQHALLLGRTRDADIKIVLLQDEKEIDNGADLYIDLLFSETKNVFASIVDKPVLVNEVTRTNKFLPSNYTRCNGWNSFLERDVMEIAARDTVFFTTMKELLEKAGWKFIVTPDIPGMIAARSVSMIINEAYFALGDEISTKHEIDIAMKTGTNYPFGPFEWAGKIGCDNICTLLKQLSAEDERYQPAPLLIKETGTVI